MSTSEGMAGGRTSRTVVQEGVLQSAISKHHEKLATFDMLPRGDKGAEWMYELQRTKEDFANERITVAECKAVIKCITAASNAEHQLWLDFRSRQDAGQTKPGDFAKAIYGYTDEEAEEFVEEGVRLLESRMANEDRCRTRVLQNGRNGRGY
ncbi:hypothetical protein EWM64_g5130 [Hericium alpestre]|uniref:Uncharacterized protein n=1 Tax=Hericium alpestre TaxID=135208 RepID=A0A4Y9ZVN9_9AGAM|nr:hypothetical protein EWM64_g5130 [Hericium alpestre]